MSLVWKTRGVVGALALLLGGCIEEHPDFVFADTEDPTGTGSVVSATDASTSGDATTRDAASESSGTPDPSTSGPGSTSSGTDGCSEELCNGDDDDCDGEIDEGCECVDGDVEACYSGDPSSNGVGACTPGTRECIDGVWDACQGDTLPTTEACNGLDDDCDGSTDEDFGQITCGMGICMVVAESCLDGMDNECVPGTPMPDEECNGLDDDCDGEVDEIPCECLNGENQDCYTGPRGTAGVGNCMTGTQTCVDGVWGTCEGAVTPIPETCDGEDDDCDGVIDNGDPGGGNNCNTGVPGVCSQGQTACVDGSVTCEQTVFSSPETCDGFDNDCDTGIDEGNPGGGADCSTGLQGACGTGETICQGGNLNCQQTVLASLEQCNGIDDDCDGSVDEGNPDAGQACDTGLMGACGSGTTTCNSPTLDCEQTVFPTGETCNGVDDDCDGSVDEGAVGGGEACPTGLDGVCGTGVSDCTGGEPVCNQTVFPSTEVCDGLDNDCDGLTDENNPGGGAACDTGEPGVCQSGTEVCTGGSIQCEPNTPASPETCDGVDEDCDGNVDNGDPGGGQACNTGQSGVCAAGTTECSGGNVDCNQNVQASPETCDSQDNDCDGVVDENNPGGGQSCDTGEPGVCSAGTTECLGGAINCNQNVLAGPEQCNGADDDCDGSTDEGNPESGQSCNTGQPGVCASGTTTCSGGTLLCNANNSPSPEQCDNLDNDCDGLVDESNPGGGVACSTGQPGVCDAGTTTCSGGMISCTQNVMPSTESCDGLDNDCDGMVDEGDPGGGAACATGQPGVCGQGTTTCSSGTLVCNPVFEPTPEECNGDDDDCDGATDEGNPGSGAACNTGQAGVCATGTTSCSGGALVCNATTSPSPEQCDGLDNDCDGTADEGNPGGGDPCSTGLEGVCGTGSTNCTGGSLECEQTTMPSMEVCGDGLDNDCNGLVDDAMCPCPNVVTDGGFEGGSPNTNWTEASSNFGTPLCTTAICGTGGGSGPHGGAWWAWFGGIGGNTEEIALVSQGVTIPVGGATLSFWLEIPACAAGGTDTFTVTVDGVVVFATDNTDPACDVIGYQQYNVDISMFGDGGTHTLQFETHTFGIGQGPPGNDVTNFFLDDVSILACG